MAINLARRSDTELLAAWMQYEWDGAPWDAVGQHLQRVDAVEAVERAQLLGIPAAVAVEAALGEPVRVTPGAPRRASTSTPVVVDLSALWAGPLCARLLGDQGARVVKVELPDRPDGARGGHPEFWDRLNGNKEQRTLSVRELHDLLDDADVLVTSARPRALEQLVLDLEQRVMERGLVWVAITGYGLTGDWRDRVAFGDDAAVAGGLAGLALMKTECFESTSSRVPTMRQRPASPVSWNASTARSSTRFSSCEATTDGSAHSCGPSPTRAHWPTRRAIRPT